MALYRLSHSINSCYAQCLLYMEDTFYMVNWLFVFNFRIYNIQFYCI